MPFIASSSMDLQAKDFYGYQCTPPASCAPVSKADCGEDSNDSFDGAMPSTAERSLLNSSCSTRAYFDDLLSPSSLNCEESLAASPCELDHVGDVVTLDAHGSARQLLRFERSNSAPLLSSSSACRDSVARMIGHEAQRQWEVRPNCRYLERHQISEDMRSVAVRWLSEVTAACNLKPITLVLATSYLDRFLTVAKDVTSCMLQLISVAALSLAAKQEEVLQPTPAEWTAIADNVFRMEDLVCMEWIVFHHLSWRGRTPTAMVFANLFACGLDISVGDVTKAACYLVELSILDFGMLQHDYSTIAAAALLLAHQNNNLSLDVDALLALAPFLSLEDIDACSKALWNLHLKTSQADCA